LAVQALVPAALQHPLREHGVEQHRARRRQQHAALRAANPGAGEQRPRAGQVAAAVAKPLQAEGVGEPARRDRPQALLDRVALARHLAQHQPEMVAAQCTARQLAPVPCRRQHPDALDRQRFGRRRLPCREVDAEALPGDRVPVLEAGVADRVRRHAGPARQLPRQPGSVGATFLDPEQQVFAFAARLEAKLLVHHEVFRSRAQQRAQHRRAECSVHAGRRSSSATAWAAMPSPRPVKPRRSLVVALTLTAPTPTSRSAATWVRIASRCGASLGASQTTTLSTLETRQPCWRSSASTWRSIIRLSAPAQRGSPGGKWWPMSPSASAPSSASQIACNSTSPSEWAWMPRSKGSRTPPRTTWSPGPKAWTS